MLGQRQAQAKQYAMQVGFPLLPSRCSVQMHLSFGTQSLPHTCTLPPYRLPPLSHIDISRLEDRSAQFQRTCETPNSRSATVASPFRNTAHPPCHETTALA